MICVKYGNAIYVVKNRLPRRMLPSDFGSWFTTIIAKWSSWGEFDLLLNNSTRKVRVKMGCQKAEVFGYHG